MGGMGSMGKGMGMKGPELGPRFGSGRGREEDLGSGGRGRPRDEDMRRSRDDEVSPKRMRRREPEEGGDSHDLDSPRDGPKSAIVSSNSASPFDEKPSPRTKIDGKEKKRQNRLLGSLLTGTLSRFKKEASDDKNKKAAHEKKKEEVMAKIRAKEFEEREQAREERRKLFQEQRQKELKERNELARQQASKEFELLTLKWSNHRDMLQGYIRTSCEPSICWLPAEHTDQTKALLEAVPMMLAEETTKLREAAEKHFMGEQEKWAQIAQRGRPSGNAEENTGDDVDNDAGDLLSPKNLKDEGNDNKDEEEKDTEVKEENEDKDADDALLSEAEENDKKDED